VPGNLLSAVAQAAKYLRRRIAALFHEADARGESAHDIFALAAATDGDSIALLRMSSGAPADGAFGARSLPCPVLVADVPSVALRLAIEALHPIPTEPRGRHPSAVVAVSALIGSDVVLGAGVVIEDDVVVGDGCVVGPNVVLRHGVCLGLRVRVGPGTVIGDDGFVFDDDGVPLRPVASVVIGDDVWLGANVSVDRGLLRDTRIGARGRIDNLVQVGHDVVIGANVVIVAQVGIAGWVTIGDGVTIAQM
jgi:UDP-3-O-[3-hydroxymyristoyl] glucosamine N-acyltransferase